MKVKVKELVPGQVIRVEYGDYENWVNFQVDAVKPDGRYINVDCHAGSYIQPWRWSREEIVEVVENA